jgi:hypothetical protein
VKENALFEIRGWNLKITKKIQNKGDRVEKHVNLEWDATIIDPGKPWVAVVIPDGRMNEMKELHNIKMGN